MRVWFGGCRRSRLASGRRFCFRRVAIRPCAPACEGAPESFAHLRCASREPVPEVAFAPAAEPLAEPHGLGEEPPRYPRVNRRPCKAGESLHLRAAQYAFHASVLSAWPQRDCSGACWKLAKRERAFERRISAIRAGVFSLTAVRVCHRLALGFRRSLECASLQKPPSAYPATDHRLAPSSGQF